MARGKRKVPDINSSSTADIAFLLLIFFLITTSMDTDRGLARLLPPPPEDQDQDNTDKIKERNVLQVYLNKDDALMCGNDYIGVEQLRKKLKNLLLMPAMQSTCLKRHRRMWSFSVRLSLTTSM